MDTKSGETNILFNISAVERDTGLSKDTLRIWERRYNFPRPLRDAHGDRAYTRVQIEKLRLIKKLLDQGHRPGRIVGLDDQTLSSLVLPPADSEPPPREIDIDLRLLRSHQTPELRRHLTHTMARQGLQRFIIDTVTPLTQAVGDAWVRGDIAVFEEHLYTELMQNLLRNAISGIQTQGNRPRVLLTSLPGEQHNLGLLMLEGMLTVENTQCIPLGTETPAMDIVNAAQAHAADIVALSFSAAYSEPRAIEALAELREMLPKTIMLCAGGHGVSRTRRRVDGVDLVISFEHMTELVRQWRSGHASH